MIRAAAVLLAVGAPAGAQVGTLSFDAGKALPMSSGEWSYVATTTGNQARYGAHLVLQCDKPTRTVTINRPGSPVTALTIVTDTATQALPPNGRLSAYDPLLDAMAFSRSRFLVSGGTGPVLAIPSWPEAARAIEDCRN